ncbi:MAG: pyruvate, phosphate dikinase [Omnitrophica bacterium RIFCSPLOWO2_12_FULL_50_11]|nr:MAG: pyruvate, phosphate dikinase [Omnitrophica bacterium RIFCSPLOWO2_12_FULL_50_11]
MQKQKKFVYFFGRGAAEGNAQMKELLGGKGANLAEMTRLGVPVPPGFTITTEACSLFYEQGKKWPAGLEVEVDRNLKELEVAMGARFGHRENPLLVSVRSGAAVSMPGMMDTVLNLGLNSDVVQGLIIKTENERFAWDAYRRFVQMFGNVVMGIPHDEFEHILEKKKKQAHAETDVDLSANDLKDLVRQFKKFYEEHTGEPFPVDPREQLSRAVHAVFNSWNNPRAVKYRELHHIGRLLGTAVNVQAMVFGNMGVNSGTGVCFTRNPSVGTNEFYGEFLVNAQGEDVVAGIRTPEPLDGLKRQWPELYKQLVRIREKLEHHYKDMQDMEFTIQEGKLYLLQTRQGKRTAQAAVKIAVDMVKEGLISKEVALTRVPAGDLDQLLHPTFDAKGKKELIAQGLPASPGAATGKVVFSADSAEEWSKKGEKVILVRQETSPEDIGGMHAAEGILTARGGMTSHAAVVARGMGKCCVAGCESLNIDYERKLFRASGVTVREGDYISLDGTVGEIYLGQVATAPPTLSGDFAKLMRWADETRRLRVRTNADTPKDAKMALKFGAEGIGLCRTEHMFFEDYRILAVREMILADTKEERERALAKLLPMQRQDFVEIFETMAGYPVTIRLLDPPLHEFLPHERERQLEMAEIMKVPFEKIRDKVAGLVEFNPMLGHRGCRLGISYPEIYDMQSRAIMEAACDVKQRGIRVHPEIMIPLVGTDQEFKTLKAEMTHVIEQVFDEKKISVPYSIGTMIEIPRAAVVADKIAEEAEFFSFGTNDLTQMTFGYSRDDAGAFVTNYVKRGILDNDPFQSLDREGVGVLIRWAMEKGRQVRKDLKIGICGEHGGDPASVEFCHEVGMDYVSCSPFRVPVARLAAAQAVIKAKS